MFHFPRFAPHIAVQSQRFRSVGFPHSDISGSKVAWHLPEAYRRHAASFIAFQSLGIHHTPLLILFIPHRRRGFKDRNNLLLLILLSQNHLNFYLPISTPSKTHLSSCDVMEFCCQSPDMLENKKSRISRDMPHRRCAPIAALQYLVSSTYRYNEYIPRPSKCQIQPCRTSFFGLLGRGSCRDVL